MGISKKTLDGWIYTGRCPSRAEGGVRLIPAWWVERGADGDARQPGVSTSPTSPRVAAALER